MKTIEQYRETFKYDLSLVNNYLTKKLNEEPTTQEELENFNTWQMKNRNPFSKWRTE